MDSNIMNETKTPKQEYEAQKNKCRREAGIVAFAVVVVTAIVAFLDWTLIDLFIDDLDFIAVVFCLAFLVAGIAIEYIVVIIFCSTIIAGRRGLAEAKEKYLNSLTEAELTVRKKEKRGRMIIGCGFISLAAVLIVFSILSLNSEPAQQIAGTEESKTLYTTDACETLSEEFAVSESSTSIAYDNAASESTSFAYTTKHKKNSSPDDYDVNNYDHAEDFYYDHPDDFIDYEDAESYYNTHHKKKW